MLLSPLLDVLFPPRDTELLVRHATFEDVARVLSPTLLNSDGYRIVSLLPYQEPLVQASIVEAKFHNNKKASVLLSQVLLDYLLEALSDTTTPTTEVVVLIPIPLSSKRKRARGYNQVEEILRPLSASTEAILDATILERTRDTSPQTTLLKNARLQNMLGAFCVRKEIDPDIRYILVDDVVTTGATMTEALSTLSRAGARKVSALTLAH